MNGDNCRAALAMFAVAAGGESKYRARPFSSISCCHVVPPLRFAVESCEALEAAARGGMCITLLSAAQAGATAPAALAGTIVQAVAETLAGLVFVNLIDPLCRANLGTWPFVSDLRTGAMSAGSPELALVVAGCAQMAAFYDLPGSVAAGMTDSKLPDAQSGAEKAYTLALAANAGSTLIMESAGMHASLLGASSRILCGKHFIKAKSLQAISRSSPVWTMSSRNFMCLLESKPTACRLMPRAH